MSKLVTALNDELIALRKENAELKKQIEEMDFLKEAFIDKFFHEEIRFSYTNDLVKYAPKKDKTYDICESFRIELWCPYTKYAIDVKTETKEKAIAAFRQKLEEL